MLLKDLYSKDITRNVNPAVSATSFDGDTPKTEIEEYVFTDEIMNGQFRILNAIKNNNGYSHVGIWIDGYYGSGKSHFLKYLDYCIKPEYQEEALNRFIEAREAIDPLDDKHNLEFDVQELKDIAKWLKTATVDNCIFNLETSYDQSTDKRESFLQVFWSEFNKLRGFNEFNITLAQNLEKPLSEKGVFDEFKALIAEEGGDWTKDGADLIDNELDWVLEIAKKVMPTLAVDNIRERIIRRDYHMSIESFARELKSWLDSKGDNYRLILLVDEVSQFINDDRDRYLNLQEIITRLSEACDNKVWIACTAQQDLSEVINNAKVAQGRESMGKIMGRFEVKVSLKGTQPEVITQKRILDKKESAKKPLLELYKKEENGFSQRFALPTSYKGYTSADDFIDFYPFVPYQFALIMQVFNNFQKLGYVAKETKGNERSIIKVVHSTARTNAGGELGTLMSFDQLYDNMFETGLQARGQKAVLNAENMAREYQPDPKFARRVVNVLFMICNISDTDKLLFPATVQNITTLLLNDFTTPFLTLKEDVKKVVEYLCEKNIIREEKPKKGGLDVFYSFYSEEEMKVAELIKSQIVDTTYQADQLRDIIQKYITSLRNKEQFKTRSFAVGGNVMQRTFLSNNPDVVVEFNMDNGVRVEDMILTNEDKKLLFLCGEQFHSDKKLLNDFIWYCMVQKYAETPVANEENAKVRDEFGKRAKENLNNYVIPKIREILDTCPIMTGNTEIDPMQLTGKKGADRYSRAIEIHLGNLYDRAYMVENSATYPRDAASLRQKIMRPVNTGDYDGMGAALTPAEQEVERWLIKQGSLDVNLSSITSHFAQRPFGWLETCTIYVVNELVRRHRRDFSYSNNPSVDMQTVASRVLSETNKFSVREGKAIPQELINKFVKAWKQIFGQSASFSSTDSTQIFNNAQEHLDKKLIGNYEAMINDNRRYNFINPLRQAVELFHKWVQIRDAHRFFTTVIDEVDEASKIFDTCKEVIEFVHDQLDKFKDIVRFADENRENFSFLPEDQKELAAELKALESKEWPIRIKHYIDAKKEISKSLDAVRGQYREEIKREYEKTYEFLCQNAVDEGLDKSLVAEPVAVYSTKCLAGSILALRNNLDTNEYFQREAAKLVAAKREKETPKPVPSTDPATGTPSTPATPKPYPVACTMTLDIRVIGLDSEAAVDKYLARLKKKIMEKINDNKIVTIKQ